MLVSFLIVVFVLVDCLGGPWTRQPMHTETTNKTIAKGHQSTSLEYPGKSF